MTAMSAGERGATRLSLRARASWLFSGGACAANGRTAIGSSQRVQERNDQPDLAVRQRAVELRRRHLAYGIAEGRSAAVMEIRRCRCHVAQAGHTQDLRIGRSKRAKDAVSLKQVAANIDALMTGHAAERLEQPITVLLFGRERRRITGKPAVERASGRDQRAFVAGDGVEQARTVRSTSIGL